MIKFEANCIKMVPRGSEATENASTKPKALGIKATENASAKHKAQDSEATENVSVKNKSWGMRVRSIKSEGAKRPRLWVQRRLRVQSDRECECKAQLKAEGEKRPRMRMLSTKPEGAKRQRMRVHLLSPTQIYAHITAYADMVAPPLPLDACQFLSGSTGWSGPALQPILSNNLRGSPAIISFIQWNNAEIREKL